MTKKSTSAKRDENLQEGSFLHADSEYRTQKIVRPSSRELWPIFVILTRKGTFVDSPVQCGSALALYGLCDTMKKNLEITDILFKSTLLVGTRVLFSISEKKPVEKMTFFLQKFVFEIFLEFFLIFSYSEKKEQVQSHYVR